MFLRSSGRRRREGLRLAGRRADAHLRGLWRTGDSQGGSGLVRALPGRADLARPLPASERFVNPQARRELEQAFLRILRGREPGMVFALLAPDELHPVLDGGTLAGAGGGGDNSPVEDGGE